jgi:hypothetical protein
MSGRSGRLVLASLFESTLDLLWRQWRAIGAAATGQPVTRQVDPEALCLASLVFQDREPRLWIVMSDWIRLAAPLVSVQRLKNLAVQFPDVGKGVAALGRVAWQEGRDARWKRLAASPQRLAPRTSPKQRSAGPALAAPPALPLRLRAAFTVSVKADLLAFLLGQPYRVTVSTAAVSLGYTVPTVFRSLQDLRAAGLVESADLPSAAEYWVDAGKWYDLLGGERAIARWGFWRETLVYVCAVSALESRPEHRGASDYARATAFRELASQHEAGLVRAGVIERGVPRSPSLGDWREFHDALAARIAALA